MFESGEVESVSNSKGKKPSMDDSDADELLLEASQVYEAANEVESASKGKGKKRFGTPKHKNWIILPKSCPRYPWGIT